MDQPLPKTFRLQQQEHALHQRRHVTPVLYPPADNTTVITNLFTVQKAIPAELLRTVQAIWKTTSLAARAGGWYNSDSHHEVSVLYSIIPLPLHSLSPATTRCKVIESRPRRFHLIEEKLEASWGSMFWRDQQCLKFWGIQEKWDFWIEMKMGRRRRKQDSQAPFVFELFDSQNKS
jgi:hypothetical protein